MAAHWRRNGGPAVRVQKKDTDTKAARRRIAAQAARAAALAHKQAGLIPSLRRGRGRPVPAPPALARGRARGPAPAHGHPGRVPPAPPAPVGRPPARGGAGHGGAPFAPAGCGRVLPPRGGGGGDMSDSEDSRIHDPAGVQDDGVDHPGDDSQGEEEDDEDHEGMASLGPPPEDAEEIATQRIRARSSSRPSRMRDIQVQEEVNARRVQQVAELKAARQVARQAQRAGQWADRLLAARRGVPLFARMEGVNVRVKLALEGYDLPHVPALVPAQHPLIACERFLTIPYVKGVCCSYLGERIKCVDCDTLIWPQEKGKVLQWWQVCPGQK
jgi:hypothetical protein